MKKQRSGNNYAFKYYKSRLLSYEKDFTRIKIIESLIGSNSRILDIGCYDGTIGKLLIDRNNEVHGIDGSEDALKVALQRGIKAKTGDLEERFDFEDNFFDVVLAGEIIEHILDTDSFISEIKRVLKPSGYLVLSTPNVASLGRRAILLFGGNPYFEASLGFPPEAVAGHIRFFTKDLLLRFLTHSNFKIVNFTSDVINFSPSGRICNNFLATVFPTLGKSLIVKAQNIK